MSLQAAKDFFAVLEYACVGGTEEYQEDLFNEISIDNEDQENNHMYSDDSSR